MTRLQSVMHIHVSVAYAIGSDATETNFTKLRPRPRPRPPVVGLESATLAIGLTGLHPSGHSNVSQWLIYILCTPTSLTVPMRSCHFNNRNGVEKKHAGVLRRQDKTARYIINYSEKYQKQFLVMKGN